ncbi:hypothetical protein BV375_23320 [Nostoc sp. 106C]|nr:hypothetical protein BV375_23320 [Nostoc sp. 106C]
MFSTSIYLTRAFGMNSYCIELLDKKIRNYFFKITPHSEFTLMKKLNCIVLSFHLSLDLKEQGDLGRLLKLGKKNTFMYGNENVFIGAALCLYLRL